MIKSTDILMEKSGAVAVLSFNRPDVRNAVNAATFAQMEVLLDEVAKDESVRVLVLTGIGGQFCAGADLNPPAKDRDQSSKGSGVPGDLGGDVLERGNRCILRLRNLNKPVLASIEGNAVGMGCSLALACDLRIATANARFGFTFSRLGLGPDGGASYFLTRLVGPAKALELLWFGDIFDAARALELGLINKLVRQEELQDVTWQWAERLAKGAPIAQAMTKEAICQSLSLPLESMLDLETRNQRIASRTRDLQEGISAFFARRQPEFCGR